MGEAGEALNLLLGQPAIIIALVLMSVAVIVLGFVLYKTFEQPTKTVKLLNDILEKREKQHKVEIAEERAEHMQEQQELKERIEALEAEMAATNARLEKKIVELGDANKVIAGMSEQISRLQTGLDAEIEARKAVEAEMLAVQQERAATELERDEARAEAAKLRAKVEELETEIETLKARLDSAEARNTVTLEVAAKPADEEAQAA